MQIPNHHQLLQAKFSPNNQFIGLQIGPSELVCIYNTSIHESQQITATTKKIVTLRVAISLSLHHFLFKCFVN